ncbi:MAG: hypothetical protein MR800_04200 [Collinsella sp.]|nr:hypothetical protein [Collinsella sp.]
MIAGSEGQSSISHVDAAGSIKTRALALQERAQKLCAGQEWEEALLIADKALGLDCSDDESQIVRIMANLELDSADDLEAAIEDGDLSDREERLVQKKLNPNSADKKLEKTERELKHEGSASQASVKEEPIDNRASLVSSAKALKERERARIGETQRLLAEEERLSKQNRQYTEALNAFAAGKYEKSMKLFDQLGDLFDSKDLAARSKKEYELEQERLERERRKREEEARKKKEAEEKKRRDSYAKAKRDLEQGRYKEAAAAFKSLGSFEDSIELKRLAEQKYEEQERRRKEADFSKAETLIERGELESALSILKKLGTFNGADARAKDVEADIKLRDDTEKFSRAEKLAKEGKLEKALALFKELGAFNGADARAKDVEADIKLRDDSEKYSRADKLMKTGDYKEAHKLFSELGSFSDSKSRAKEALELHEIEERNAANYQKAQDHVLQKRYQEAIDIFDQLGEYKDSRSQKELAIVAAKKRKRNVAIAVVIVIAVIAIVVCAVPM